MQNKHQPAWQSRRACGGGPIAAELAGNSLGQYPYFEYVKAFNEDATVEVAIDPTRYPEIVGRTCDIYVVEAKTSSGWQVDPSLTDVTAGGAQTQSFGGSTIQENTFTATGPFELDADAGLGLGVGYDVVLDCDQDGELSFGDYIDGLSNDAGLYVVHDTSQMALATTSRDYEIGFGLKFPATVKNFGQLGICRQTSRPNIRIVTPCRTQASIGAVEIFCTAFTPAVVFFKPAVWKSVSHLTVGKYATIA